MLALLAGLGSKAKAAPSRSRGTPGILESGEKVMLSGLRPQTAFLGKGESEERSWWTCKANSFQLLSVWQALKGSLIDCSRLPSARPPIAALRRQPSRIGDYTSCRIFQSPSSRVVFFGFGSGRVFVCVCVRTCTRAMLSSSFLPNLPLWLRCVGWGRDCTGPGWGAWSRGGSRSRSGIKSRSRSGSRDRTGGEEEGGDGSVGLLAGARPSPPCEQGGNRMKKIFGVEK